MKISVKVIPNAKKQLIELLSDKSLKIHLKAKPVEGKANQALIKALAEYYNVSKSSIQILQGEKAKNKLVCIKWSRSLQIIGFCYTAKSMISNSLGSLNKVIY